jgi:thioredoxin 1
MIQLKTNIGVELKRLKAYADTRNDQLLFRAKGSIVKRVNRYFAGICPWCVAILLVAIITATGAAMVKDFSSLPVKGMVTMIDLGATECVPCKLMAPIMEKMEKQYDGKAAIVFIDVWKHREQARRFGIRAIPTQIFFNENGREVFRHVGFMSEAAIVNQLKQMGVE